MWLINTTTHQLQSFGGGDIPPYAILSHTWGPDEVTFQDIQHNLALARTKSGFPKIDGTCAQAIRHGIEWAWIDSCCIDKTSSAELSEAINSMYSYYLLSRVCFIYLSDVPPLSSSPSSSRMLSLAASRWFTRGWTLQELIAPRRAIFYASDWSRIGTKGLHTDERPFLAALASVTGVFESVLAKTRQPRDYSVAERMSWAAARHTTRPEDLAYCLMGLFGVNVPVLYGEGLAHAFQRLQHEIIRTSPDETIFAWRAHPAQETADPHTGDRRRRAAHSSGLLADSPADFARSHNVHQRALQTAAPFRLFSMTNMGLSITAELIPVAPGGGGPLVVVPIGASDRQTDASPRCRLGLFLEPVFKTTASSLPSSVHAGGQTLYRRVKCDEVCFAPPGDFPRGETMEIYVLQDSQFDEMRWAAAGASQVGGRLSLSPSPSPRASPRLEFVRE